MTAFCDLVSEDWELYLLGTLAPEELLRMDAHLQEGCAECSDRRDMAQVLVTGLGTAAPAERPSPAVAARLRMRLTVGSPVATSVIAQPVGAASRVRWVRVTSYLVPWAIAACLLFAVLLLSQQRNEANMEKQALSAAIAGLHAQLAAASPARAQVVESGAADAAPTPQVDNHALEARIAELNQRVDALKAEKDAATAAEQQTRAQLASLNAHIGTVESELQKAQQSAVEARNTSGAAAAQVEALTAELAAERNAPRTAQPVDNRNQQLASFFSAKSLQEVNLRAVDPDAKGATARAFYAPGVGLVVFADALPAIPSSQCYQLWAIRNGAMRPIESAGLLQVDAQGKGYLFMRNHATLSDLTGLAITQEPSGGSVNARGRKLLFGAL